MIACVDVGYGDSTARAACVTFERWEDAHTSGECVLDTSDVRPYVPGEFYKREDGQFGRRHEMLSTQFQVKRQACGLIDNVDGRAQVNIPKEAD